MERVETEPLKIIKTLTTRSTKSHFLTTNSLRMEVKHSQHIQIHFPYTIMVNGLHENVSFGIEPRTNISNGLASCHFQTHVADNRGAWRGQDW